LDTAAAKGKALIDAAAGQSRQMEFRAEQQVSNFVLSVCVRVEALMMTTQL
jgi:hypothetical protein